MMEMAAYARIDKQRRKRHLLHKPDQGAKVEPGEEPRKPGPYWSDTDEWRELLIKKLENDVPKPFGLSLGTIQYYFSLGNVFDILMIFCTLLLGWFSFTERGCSDGIAETECNIAAFGEASEGLFHVLKAIVILELWVSTMGVFAWSEAIAFEVMPIVNSFRSIQPLLLFTAAMWFMISELLYVLQGPQGQAPLAMVSSTFYFLFVGDTEMINPYHDSPVTRPDHMAGMTLSPILFFLIFFIILFTVWILNIFIGVIGKAFETQQEQVHLTFQQERCRGVLRYLLRATMIRSNIFFLPKMGSLKMHILRTVLVLVMVVFLLLTWFSPGILGSSPFFVRVPVHFTLIFLVQILPFQRKAVPWTTADAPSGLHYLWVVEKANLEELKQVDSLEEEEEAKARETKI
jgi:hypothetical protein